MAITNKTNTKTSVAIETTPTKTTTRRATGTKTTTGKPATSITAKTATKTSNSNTEVLALREQVTTLEKKLQNLITILHTEFSTEVLQGPRGIAQLMENANLTD
jgi:hypothetical protein